MSSSGNRIDFLRALVAKKPDDARARFGLAVEYERVGDWDQAITHLNEYLRLADDEGNGFARHARALRKRGKDAEARAAFQRGIESANSHGHPSLAAELDEEMEAEEL